MELEGIRAWLEWNGLRCETIYNLLNSELSTLFHVSNGGPIKDLIRSTYCQYTQQRRLAGILKTDHGDIHLAGPIWSSAWLHLRGRAVVSREVHLSNGPLTRTSLEASHR